jgi:hypothetical protein
MNAKSILDFLKRAMGLATLRRRPALSRKMPNSIGIFYAQFSFQNRQKIKNPHFHGSFLDFLEPLWRTRVEAKYWSI